MNQREFVDGISEIDEELLERSEKNREVASAGDVEEKPQPGKTRHPWRRAGIIAAAILCVAGASAILWHGGRKPVSEVQEGTYGHDPYLVSAPKYPEVMKAPRYEDFDQNGDGIYDQEENAAFLQADKEYQEKIIGQKSIDGYDREIGKARIWEFHAKVAQQFLEERDHENKLYSPLNVYVALGMLAEASEGNTRKQVLELLGIKNVEALRVQIKGAWNMVYKEDKMKSVLASSIWLRDDLPYRKETLDVMARDYYASSYAGKMGSEEYSQAYVNWLNEQTGGLLKEQIDGLVLSPETVMSLATTVYFDAKWSSPFNANETKPGVFHAAEGDVQRDFMNRSGAGGYFYGDHFGAIQKFFDGGASMMLVLPDEGVSPYDLLTDEQVLDFLEKGSDYENKKQMFIHESIPKFDVASDRDLTGELKKLGITDAFEKGTADFSPVSDAVKDLWISKIEHGVRVIANEEGVKAAAYATVSDIGAAMPPEDAIYFTLDRPFLFVINVSGVPVFVGIVENP